MRLLLLTAIICLLVSNIVHAQTNLVAEPGFESGSISLPWDTSVFRPVPVPGIGDVDLDGDVSFLDIGDFIVALQSGVYQFEADVNGDGLVDFWDIRPFIELLTGGDRGTISVVDDNVVEGDKALVVDHGSYLQSSGFSQDVTVVPGRSYIFSASVFFENGIGGTRLSVQNGEDGEELANQSFSANLQIWEKAQVRFTATGNQVRLLLGSEATTGETYFDAVKLLESGGGGIQGSNLIANEVFENDVSWDLLRGAGYSTAEKRFGSRSLLLDGSSGSLATQRVLLQGRGFTPDQPIYTLSAHIKTTGTVPVPKANPNWAAVANDFPTISGVGAALKVSFYDSNNEHLRTICSPYFFSKATEFTERKFSFLPPKETSQLVVVALVSRGDFKAHFDNVQLSAWEVPEGSSYVDRIGNTEVEAPEAGTYVTATPSLGLQVAVDNVTTTGSPDYGKLVWAGPGNYRHQHVLLKSTTHLRLHKDAKLIKDSDSPGDPLRASNWFGGHVKSAGYGQPATDVIVEGGTLDNNNGVEDFPGSAIAIYGDRVIVRNVNIPRFSKTPDDFAVVQYAASAIFLMGHHTYVYNNFISGPKSIAGQDGIHLWGGTHSHIMSNKVLAADDGLGLFTGTNKLFRNGEPIVDFDRNISEVEAYNNIFDSVGARCVALGLAVPRGNERLSSSVSKVRIRNFEGVCGGIHPQVIVMCAPWDDRPIANPMSLPDAQVKDILLENGSLTGYVFPMPGDDDPLHPASERGGARYTGGSLQEDPRLPPFGIRVFTHDVGWVQNVLFENITAQKFENFEFVNSNGDVVSNSTAVDVTKAGDPELLLEQPNDEIRFRFCTIGQTSGDAARHAYRIEGQSEVEVFLSESDNSILSPGIKLFDGQVVP